MNIEEYKKHLYHPKSDNYNLLNYLKKEGDLAKIKKVLKHFSGHPFIKSVLRSNVLPKEYSDLRRQKPIPFSGNLIGETAFYLTVFEEHKQVINTFLSLKAKFEQEFLLSKYDLAEQTLNEVEKSCGKSFWLIENYILLKEYKEGVESNWTEVSRLSKNVKDPLVLFFIENLSKKGESKISYFRYLNIFNNQLSEVINYPPLYEYLSFRLNYSGYSGYENLAYFLFAESSSSIIDRYVILKEVLLEMFSVKFQEHKEILKSIATELYEICPDDVLLIQILAVLDKRYVNKLPINDELYKLMEEYSVGNYSFCIKTSPDIILKYPQIIETYEIYIKSLIECTTNQTFEHFPTIIRNILEILYSIYSNISSIEQNIDSGLKLCTSFSSTSWSKQFLSLINAATSHSFGNKLFTIQFDLSSQILNPRILYYIKENELDLYTEDLKKITSITKSTLIINDILMGNYNNIDNYKEIKFDKKILYYGRALFKIGKYEDAKSHYENINKELKYSSIFEEELIVNLFRCYIKLQDSENACSLFVRQYIKNKASTKRLNSGKLLELLENGEIEKLSGKIELPIFYQIASSDSYQQYVAYDIFMDHHNVLRPIDLLQTDRIYDEMFLFFLREVCTIEVMHHSYHFSGTDDIENERLEILNKLIVIDNENEDSYIKEITELNQIANIRKAIREVNKGRISINIQQLRNNETNNIKEAFTRFKEIEYYTRNKDLVGIDTSISMLNELTTSNIEEPANIIIYTSDPAYISFKVIFIEIRDKFLLSKEYGLDGYLSTRIRHGALLNHIRSVFESQNIISQRDKDNNYIDNEYWNNALQYLLPDKMSKIQDSIKKFSKNIDEYTEYIIKELIQVKTEKHTKKIKALFDYSLSNKEIAILFASVRESIKDHNTFLSYIFEYLQLYTEGLLCKIRDYINTEIKENYNKILQDFNTEVKLVLSGQNFPDLTNAINLCGTTIQNELKNISEWFFLSNSSKDFTLDLNVLIQTSIQITNTISPNNKLNPKIIEDISIPMSGTIHMIYLCRILLDNIIVHSKLNPNELDIEISTRLIDNEFLELSFKNNVSSDINLIELEERLKKIKNKWDFSSNDYENIDKEGGSGFDKIRRIIVFDLQCERYYFDYKIEENYVTMIISIDFITIPKYDERN